jgi:hypothetical protein
LALLALARCSQHTAGRDIDDLSHKAVLVRDLSGGRSTSYSLIVGPGDAIAAVARYVLAHADDPAWSGAKMPTLRDRQSRIAQIQAIGRELQTLAEHRDAPSCREFKTQLQGLYQLGLFPDGRLVSAVALTCRAE